MRTVGAALALAALLALADGSALGHGWNYEDGRVASDAGWRAQPSRWLVTATWPADPHVAHAGSLALHALDGALLAVLAVRLGAAAWWLPAGLFLLHPLQTEAVAYAAARGDLLAAAGCLAAAVAATWRGPWAALGVLAAGVAAMAGKESGVAVVALAPLVAWHRGTLGRWTWAALGPLALLALRGTGLVRDINVFEGQGVAPLAWAGLQAAAAWRMARLTLWPAGLSVDHDYAGVGALGGALALAGLLAALAWAVRRVAGRVGGHTGRLAALGVAWAALAVLPRLAVRTPLSVLPEHQWYLAAAGTSLALGALLGAWVHRAPGGTWGDAA